MDASGKAFAGKAAFVTGAASGIGRSAALAFASEGARVVVADVGEPGNQETARMIEERGGRALAVRCDVTRAEEVKAAVDRAVEALGRLDVAVNNAGVEPKQLVPTAEVPKEEWDRIIAVDLSGVFLCMKYEIPPMLKQGGGANREHLLGCRGRRHQRQSRLHRRETRRDWSHPGSGPRLRRAEHSRQRRLPRIYRHADDGSIHRR